MYQLFRYTNSWEVSMWRDYVKDMLMELGPPKYKHLVSNYIGTWLGTSYTCTIFRTLLPMTHVLCSGSVHYFSSPCNILPYCTLLFYTKITACFSLPSERTSCRVMLTTRHIWQVLKSELPSFWCQESASMFEAIGALQKGRLHHSHAIVHVFTWNRWMYNQFL